MARSGVSSKVREVICTHCHGVNEVSARAMSVFCNECRKRLILEDYVVKSFQGLRSYQTCGNVIVEKSGRIVASTQAQNMIVRGKVEGDVTAAGHVDVAATGTLLGNIQASGLCVEHGARLDGFCEIRPVQDQPPAPAKPAPRSAGRKIATPPKAASTAKSKPAKTAQPRSRSATPAAGTTKVKAISTRRRRST